MPFDFTASEQCTNCSNEFEFTVQAILTGPDEAHEGRKNIITPIGRVTCPRCGAMYRFDTTASPVENVSDVV